MINLHQFYAFRLICAPVTNIALPSFTKKRQKKCSLPLKCYPLVSLTISLYTNVSSLLFYHIFINICFFILFNFIIFTLPSSEKMPVTENVLWASAVKTYIFVCLYTVYIAYCRANNCDWLCTPNSLLLQINWWSL